MKCCSERGTGEAVIYCVAIFLMFMISLLLYSLWSTGLASTTVTLMRDSSCMENRKCINSRFRIQKKKKQTVKTNTQPTTPNDSSPRSPSTFLPQTA